MATVLNSVTDQLVPEPVDSILDLSCLPTAQKALSNVSGKMENGSGKDFAVQNLDALELQRDVFRLGTW